MPNAFPARELLIQTRLCAPNAWKVETSHLLMCCVATSAGGRVKDPRHTCIKVLTFFLYRKKMTNPVHLPQQKFQNVRICTYKYFIYVTGGAVRHTMCLPSW